MPSGVAALYSCHSRNKVTPFRLSSWCTVAQSGTICVAGALAGADGNSNRSSVPASQVAGKGQDKPAAWARRTYSATAGRLIPRLWAIFRSLSPWPHLRRNTSYTRRMANLCAGICSSLLIEKGAGYRGFARHRLRSTPRGGWQPSRAIGGSFAVELAAAFAWNRWQACYGISGSFAVESV